MQAVSNMRPCVDGKFFRVGERKFHVKGVAYGPFGPGVGGDFFPNPDQALRDLDRIQELGANVLRVYYPPPRWFLDQAESHGLKVLVDIPWNKHLCVLDSESAKDQARETVQNAVLACARHPAVFAYSVANEIAPDVVRWSGTRAVEEFIDELIAIAKAADPGCLCAFTSYPPTEFLNPRKADFLSFNVYLHSQRPLENYLARLQMMADGRPLLLAETGVDSLSNGESKQAEILGWQIETVFRAGLAGVVVYSFTDDWYRGGTQITDWAFGLTTRDREPKPAFFAVQRQFSLAPYFPLPRIPRVSVVVASYNGARTLESCLASLERLNYPNYEVILVDDGSTDNTSTVAARYKSVRRIQQPNRGLSAARNTGLAAATGEVVAYTDSDCRADEDWLFYLIADLLRGSFVGVGGHNLLPDDDSCVAAAVMVSPGGPAHVMLDDRVAEHIPGCNMAFYKWALVEIGGFDPLFRIAGDDVDICWRLQQRGYQIGFSPAGFVWHYRRSTVRAYLQQQRGYGAAEALLVRRHPEYFNGFGSSVWRGRIYSPAAAGIALRRPMIYRGTFATGFFQTLYRSQPSYSLMLATTLEYHVLVTLPLLIVSAAFHRVLFVAAASALFSMGVCVFATCQAELNPAKQQFWSRPLVALLFLLQPIARGWARYRGRMRMGPAPVKAAQNLAFMQLRDRGGDYEVVEYWAETRMDRLDFLKAILSRLDAQGWQSKLDAGWSACDVEVFGSRWASLQLTTVGEPHSGGRQLLRCRLSASWSFPAKLAFFSMLGVEFAAIGLLRSMLGGIWLLLAALPVFVWFALREQRDLQRLVFLLIDKVAAERGLVRVYPKPSDVPLPHI
jgi:glycosyltransferase involved in cell wall biosynthesis